MVLPGEEPRAKLQKMPSGLQTLPGDEGGKGLEGGAWELSRASQAGSVARKGLQRQMEGQVGVVQEKSIKDV